MSHITSRSKSQFLSKQTEKKKQHKKIRFRAGCYLSPSRYRKEHPFNVPGYSAARKTKKGAVIGQYSGPVQEHDPFLQLSGAPGILVSMLAFLLSSLEEGTRGQPPATHL
jgi:hypothetical protein